MEYAGLYLAPNIVETLRTLAVSLLVAVDGRRKYVRSVLDLSTLLIAPFP